MMACGVSEQEACTRPAVASAYQPDRPSASRLAGRLERFRALYRAVKPLWPEVTGADA
jgi:sugar (pentulose or hexulose) kinase